MNPAEYNALHILHVLSVFVMGATVFYATAGAPETRKKALMWSGVASLLALGTGVRMAAGIYHGMPAWIWVKFVCWLGLAAFVGLAYKRRAQAGLWITLTLVLVTVALIMVYAKPF